MHGKLSISAHCAQSWRAPTQKWNSAFLTLECRGCTIIISHNKWSLAIPLFLKIQRGMITETISKNKIRLFDVFRWNRWCAARDIVFRKHRNTNPVTALCATVRRAGCNLREPASTGQKLGHTNDLYIWSQQFRCGNQPKHQVSGEENVHSPSDRSVADKQVEILAIGKRE